MELGLCLRADLTTMMQDKQLLFGLKPALKLLGHLPDLGNAGTSSAGQFLSSMEASLSWLRDWLVSSKFRSS